MAYDVEDKVVQMRFDNRDFNPNIEASIKSLEKLEKSLQMTNATKGFDNVEKAAKNFNLNPALMAVSNLEKGFSALQVAGITVIQDLTHKALAYAEKVANAFAIAPLTSGWGEYSEQMNSTQVIMSNTGDTIETVTASLDVLNEYADRTIYSFGQMTQAIGKFAAAGVNLHDATDAIQGLSSAAATVGANNQQLFSAYYNLAQSLQLGYVQLIDWKSLENSTIGNKTMREAFIKTAIEMGKFTEESKTAQKAYADFRGSLQDKWLTSDIVLTTLQKYSMQIKDFSDEVDGGHWVVDAAGNKVEKLVEQYDSLGKVVGYTSKKYGQLNEWEVKLAETAFKSATEIKSFQQMWDTLTEAAGTGWAETWKIIFGNLEKAKDLWTDVSKSIESVITAFTNLRNEALKMWAAWGGQQDLTETIKSLARTFSNIGRTIAEAIANLTGSVTELNDDVEDGAKTAGKSLAVVTRKIRIFVESIERGTSNVKAHAEALAKLLKPLSWVAKALGFIAKVVVSIVILGDALIKTIINIIFNIREFPELIKEIFGEAAWNGFAAVLKVILAIAKLLCSALNVLFSAIQGIVGLFVKFENETHLVSKFMTGLKVVISTLANTIFMVVDALGDWLFKMSELLREGPKFENIINGISKAVGGNVVSGLVNGLKKGSGEVVKGAKSIGTTLIDALKDVLEIHSPSRKGIAIGAFFVAGIVGGILSYMDKLKSVSGKIGSTALTVVKNSMDFSKAKGKNKSNGIKEFQRSQTNSAIALSKALVKSKEDAAGIKKESSKALDYYTVTIEYIKEKLKGFASTVSEFYNDTLKPMIKNLNAGKIMAFAFSAAIIVMIVKIAKTIETLGGLFERVGVAVVKLADGFAEMADGVADNLKAMAAETRSKAFENMANSIFTIAKALALLVVVAKWNPEGLKQAAIILGIFTATLTLMIAAFSILYSKLQQLNSIGNAKKAGKQLLDIARTSSKMFTIAAMLLAVTISLGSFTKSLAILADIDTKSAIKALGILEIILVSLVGVIIVLSKMTPKLTKGTLIMFAFSYAIKLFSEAMVNISGTLEDGIARLTAMSWVTIAKLTLLIAALTVASAYINKASTTIVKATMALSMFSIALAVMGFILGKVDQENGLVTQAMTYFTSGGAVMSLIAVIAAMAVAAILISKYARNLYAGGAALKEIIGPLARLSLTFVAIIAALAGLFGVIAIAKSKLTDQDYLITIKTFSGIMGAMLVIIAGLIATLTLLGQSISKKQFNSSVFENFNKALKAISYTLFSLSINLLLIVGAMALFWNKYDVNEPKKGLVVLGSAILVIAALAGIVAGLIAVVGRNMKSDGGKNVLKVLIPIIFMIGQLVTSMAILTALAHDTNSYLLAIAGISAIMWPLVALVAALGKLDQAIEKEGSKKTSSAKKLDSMFKMLVGVIAGVAVLMAEIAAFSFIFANPNLYDGYSRAMAVFATVMLAVVAAVIGISIACSQIKSKNSVNGMGAIVGILAMLGVLAAELAGVLVLLNHFHIDPISAAIELASIGLVLAGAVTGVLMTVTQMAKHSVNKDKVVNIIKLLATIGALGVAISGAVFVMGKSGFNGYETAAALGGLSVALSAVTSLALLLAKMSGKIKIDKTNIGMLLATAGAIGGLFTMMANATRLLGEINVEKFDTIRDSLIGIGAALVVFSAVFVGLSWAIKAIPVQYIAIAIAALGAITIAFAAFTGAIYALSYAPLETLADGLAALFNVGGKAAAVGAAFIVLGLGMAVIGVAAVIASTALFGVGVALLLTAGALAIVSATASGFSIFIESLKQIDGKMLLMTMGLLTILSLFAPALAIISLSIGFMIGMAAALISAIVTLTGVIVPFTQALADAGNIIIKNYPAFWALAGAIAGLGLALLVASPGLLALAAAIGVVVIAIGTALGFATPFVLALGIMLNSLLNTIGSMKDAAIDLFNAILDKLPYVVKLLDSMKSLAPNIMQTSAALLVAGLGLTALGLGGIVASLGILALSGAIKVLHIVLKSIIGPTVEFGAVFEAIWSKGGKVAALGAAFVALGLGMIVMGAGALTSAIGLLALTGVLYLFTKLFGDLNTFIDELFKRGGEIADIGTAFIALGTGLLVLALPLVVVGAAFTIFASILAVVASVCVTILAPAIAIIAMALIPLVMAINMVVTSVMGCINGLVNLANALYNLVSMGSLASIGLGLMLIAAGFIALALAGVAIAPLIPILLAVAAGITTVSGTLYVIGDAIDYFTTKLESSASHISNALLTITRSFVSAVATIKQGINLISGSATVGASTAKNTVLGYVKGMTKGIPIFNKTSKSAAEAIQKGVTEPLGIHSPSAWFKWAATMCSSGFDKGVAGEMPKFFGEGSAMGGAVISGFTDKLKKSKLGSTIGDVVSVATGKKSLGSVADKYIGKDSVLGQAIGSVKDIFSGDKFSFKNILGGDEAESNASGIENYASALNDAGDSAGATKGTIESLTDTLKNQMKIFDRFTYDEEFMDPKELIHNMESQLRGMQNWANGIDELAVRGMSGPLLQYLSEMGPEGYKYVEAFLEMTESEFQQANALYADSLEMPGNVANQIGDSYRRAGVEIVDSVASGISGNGAARAAMDSVGEDVTESTTKTAEEVYNICDDKAKVTASDLADMAAQSGEVTGWTYFEALDKWMSGPEAAKYIASVQGKIQGQVFSFNNFDLFKSAAKAGIDGYKYVEAGWNYRNNENLKKLSMSSAKFIVEGYEEALTGSQYVAACQKAMYGLAATIIDAGNEKLEIHSPSRVAMRQGMYFVEGLANSISKYASLAEDSSENLGDSALNSLADTIQLLSAQFTDDMDTTPTITPILDLSNVRNGMAELDTMFTTKQARIAGSYYGSTYDDSTDRMEEAYRKAIQNANMELISAIQNSDQPVNVNITVDGDPEQIFKIVKVENEKETRRTGASPLMIAKRNALNVGLA